MSERHGLPKNDREVRTLKLLCINPINFHDDTPLIWSEDKDEELE